MPLFHRLARAALLSAAAAALVLPFCAGAQSLSRSRAEARIEVREIGGAFSKLHQNDKDFPAERRYQRGLELEQAQPPEFGQAAALYREAAGGGHRDAQYALATLLAEGRGVARDLAEAAQWYEQAATKGHAGAQHSLALAYARGEGRPQDLALARHWYGAAAEQGLMQSQYNLALLLIASAETEQAYTWLLIASRSGNATVKDSLDILTARIDPEQRARASASAATWKPVNAI